MEARRAAGVTGTSKRCAINDLGHACSGYPHPCQQKLWTSPRAVSFVAQRARRSRAAGLPARFEAARTKPFGSSACAWYAQAIHTLANTICGQAVWRARQAVRRIARRCANGTVPAACPIRSDADKVFRIKRLIAVCAGYPHACQHNLWTSPLDVQPCRSSTEGQRANAKTHNMMKFRTGTNIVRIHQPECPVRRTIRTYG